jgi:hypothetical protein
VPRSQQSQRRNISTRLARFELILARIPNSLFSFKENISTGKTAVFACHSLSTQQPPSLRRTKRASGIVCEHHQHFGSQLFQPALRSRVQSFRQPAGGRPQHEENRHATHATDSEEHQNSHQSSQPAHATVWLSRSIVSTIAGEHDDASANLYADKQNHLVQTNN